MSMATTKTAYSPAQKAAMELVEALRPACTRIEIVGSLRRQKPYVGDIDILAIASETPSLFENSGGRTVRDILGDLVRDGRLQLDKDGERLKSFRIPTVPVLAGQLWLAAAEQWGVMMAIRTGPADFSHAFVTQARHGGYLKDGYRVLDGRVVNEKNTELGIETPEERDFFEKATTCG